MISTGIAALVLWSMSWNRPQGIGFTPTFSESAVR